MAKRFSAQVSKWTATARLRTEVVFKQSVQDLVAEANKPVAQGGRMRVDTGFLRNSVVASLNSPARGPSTPIPDRQYPKDDSANEDVALVIADASVNDVIYIGWTARYAKFREYRDGFVEGAAKKWKQIVRRNSGRARREIR